ncbi:hypothetical protein RI367_006189 [Sorochytrium milnesiophthora]
MSSSDALNSSAAVEAGSNGRASLHARAVWQSVNSLHEKRLRRTELMESADYEVSDGPLVRQHARDVRIHDKYRHARQVFARAVVCVIIGIFAACLYLALHHGTEFITARRIEFLRRRLGSGVTTTASNVAVAWAFTFGLALAMCFLGVACILYEPSAAGSGMPEVISFLNGLAQPRYLTIKTFVCKLLGVLLIVNAGLFSGFDGPYIHLCSIFTAILVRNWKKVPVLGEWAYGEKFQQGKPEVTKSLSNTRVQLLQQFVTVGAAAGMASAFQAPVGGAVFALEEAMSFYEPSLIFRALFSAFVSMIIIAGAKQGKKFDSESLSIYSANAQCSLETPVQNYFAVAVMGVVGGVLGHGYNLVVARIRVFRTTHIQPFIYRRFLDVFLLVLLTSAVIVLIPSIPVYRDCTPLNHAISHLQYTPQSPCETTCGELSSELGNDTVISDMPAVIACRGYVGRHLCFTDDVAEVINMGIETVLGNLSVLCPGGTPPDQIVELLPRSDDDFSAILSDIRQRHGTYALFRGGILVDSLPRNKKQPATQSPRTDAQSPSNTTSDSSPVLRRLLRRESSESDGTLPEAQDDLANNPFGVCYHQMKSLLFNQPETILNNLFLRGYYNLFQSATLAVFGVLYILLSLATHHISMPTDLVIPTLIIGATFGRLYGVMVNEFKIMLGQTLVDPGAYAVIGMAAFWSGTSRMVITVIVVAIEATYDQSSLLSLILVVLVATGVGNMLGESQFHMEIEHSGVPFLPFYPSQKMHEITVGEVMTRDPLVVEAGDSLEAVVSKIGKPHLATPSMSRTARRYAAADLHNGFPIVTSARDNRLMGLILRRQVEAAVQSARDSELRVSWLDYSNLSPHSVQETCTASKAYKLFRSLGLRHLVVVNEENRVVGIITREDFAGVVHDEHGHGHDSDDVTAGHQTLHTAASVHSGGDGIGKEAVASPAVHIEMAPTQLQSSTPHRRQATLELRQSSDYHLGGRQGEEDHTQ